MILTLALELGIIACLAIYIECWRAGVRRRQKQAWERLMAQLQPNGVHDNLSGQICLDHGQNDTSEESWRSTRGASRLWSMYQNAQVMLDMADFAARNSDSVDKELLATLRGDAMQIRLSVLIALSNCACNHVKENASLNVCRAESLYTDMVVRIAELVRANGGALDPSFVGIK
jgi:hypothetical protein